MTDTLLSALILIPCLIVAIVTHEVAHGRVALMLGDTTARDLNRLSLNPLRHVDVVGTLLVPGALALSGGPVFGWAKPVPVRMDRLDNPRFGMMAVGAAGPAVNIVLALVTALVLGVLARMATGSPDALPELLLQGLITFISINVFLALFNLLPIPPFDGSHIVQGLLPVRLGEAYGRLQRYGMVVFALLIAVTWLAPQLGLIETLIGGPFNWAMDRFIGLSALIAGQ
jgi:Zn-dependent protease